MRAGCGTKRINLRSQGRGHKECLALFLCPNKTCFAHNVTELMSHVFTSVHELSQGRHRCPFTIDRAPMTDQNTILMKSNLVNQRAYITFQTSAYLHKRKMWADIPPFYTMWTTLDILVMLTHFADTNADNGSHWWDRVCSGVIGVDQSSTEKTKQTGHMKHDSDVGNAHSISDTVKPRNII